MSDKKKFNFVNDIDEQPEMVVPTVKDTTLRQTDRPVSYEEMLKQKRRDRQKYVRLSIFMTVLTIVLFVFVMLWQAKWDFMAIINGLWVVFGIELLFGWSFFVYNMNIFSPLLYGVKSFVLMFVGKRPKTDYYTYMKNIQDNQIPKYIYRIIFIFAGLVLIPAIITLVIYMN